MVEKYTPCIGHDAHGAIGLDDNATALPSLDVLATLAHKFQRLLNEQDLLVEPWPYGDGVSRPGCADRHVQALPLHHCCEARVPPQGQPSLADCKTHMKVCEAKVVK